MKKSSLLAVVFLFVGAVAQAQIKTPAPSPTAKISQEVGLGKVELEYSRPSAKGRKIFGDLVPFNEMWRTGANSSTKVTFSDDVMIGSAKVPKGSYALYTIPGEKSWVIIFYKNTAFWGTPGKDYKPEDDAARIDVAPMATSPFVETFTMGVDNVRNSGAEITLEWENTRIAVPFSVDTDSKVMADIKGQMAGPSAATYYQSARYYFEEKKDLAQALEWMNKALEKGEKFWYLRTKALILADMGRYADAIEAANRSTELAKAEDNQDYPRMNDKSIKEWSAKKK